MSVTFTEEEITDIQVESSETPEIGVVAMDQLKEAVLAGQNLKVDAVAGATLSSEAFLAAMRDAISQAGADADSLVGVTVTKEETEYQTEADVLVIGAGGAGLSAALSAAEAGASVIVLEKDGRIGGNTIGAISGISAAGARAQEELGQEGATEEAYKEYILNNPLAREELAEALAAHSGETADWLEDMGVSYKLNDRDIFQLEAAEGNGTTPYLIKAVSEHLEETGTPVYLNLRATELLTDEEGKVTGAKATNEEGEDFSFTASSVVLATGGFGQNHEMVVKYRPDLEYSITSEVSAATTGDGIVMAEALGAQLVDMDQIHFLPMTIPGYGMLSRVMPGGLPTVAIFVNKDGQRYIKEQFGSELETLMPQQPEGLTYVIYDGDGVLPPLTALTEQGVIQKAESPAELAELLGISSEALEETIAAFNEDVADGTDDAYHKDKPDSLEGTLYGFPVMLGVHYNMGGVLISPQAEVLDTEGNAIPNLYAAGEVTGGVHGSNRLDGAGVADTFTFGRIAGQNAAANAGK